MMKKTVITILLAFMAFVGASAQSAKHVLFVGNSYTEVNNLPKMVAEVAASMGDTVDYSSVTPGGCTFKQHCTNQSMTLICGGGWDAVVLQEQSQYPSFPDWQVEQDVFPYAKRLVDSVYAHNPCAEPMFYMTWGRKNGDSQNGLIFPPLATYEGMDSLLDLRYTQMALDNDAALCPVGRVWHYLRDHAPQIELYQPDDSHPTPAGTYAAACSFYVMLFHRDPDSIDYAASLSANVASAIRHAVRTVVYDKLDALQRPRPELQLVWLDTVVGSMSELFEVWGNHVDTVRVDWGDGQDTVFCTSALAGVDENQLYASLSHQYADSGLYTYTVTAWRHCMRVEQSGSFHATAEPTEPEGVGTALERRVEVSPNPAGDRVQVMLPEGAEWLEVCDLQGRTLERHGVQGGALALDVAHLPAGTYLLRTAAGTTRLVVAH